MAKKSTGLGKGLDSLIPDFYDEDFDSNSAVSLEDMLGEDEKQEESNEDIVENVDEEGIKGLVQKLTDLINNDGKVEKVDELGKKKLAYEIQKNKEGYYVVFNFEANPDLISELERNYRITDEVIKFMTIKVEE